MLTMMVAVAEFEAGVIGERTKAALEAAKARGVHVGRTGKALAKKNRAAANQRAKELRPVFVELAAMNLNDAAAELRRRKIPTATPGGKWLGGVYPGWGYPALGYGYYGGGGGYGYSNGYYDGGYYPPY